MEITIRNITKDNGISFDNDHTITLPMSESKLRELLADDEWIIVDSSIHCTEYTNILDLNIAASQFGDDLEVLSVSYLFNEIYNAKDQDCYEFTIIDFDAETIQWNNGNGVVCDDWWKGYLLHYLGYAGFPFEYTEEMEDYVRFEALWTTAECEGWREIMHNGNTYLVRR